MNTFSEYVTLPAAAKLLNIHKATLFRWIREGTNGWSLKPRKVGTRNVFKRTEVLAEYERIMFDETTAG